MNTIVLSEALAVDFGDSKRYLLLVKQMVGFCGPNLNGFVFFKAVFS